MDRDDLSLEEAGRVMRDAARQGHVHYVYFLIFPEGDGYVGKGTGYRFADHRTRWLTYRVSFDSFHLDAVSALKREVEAISGVELILRNVLRGGTGCPPSAIAASNSLENRERKRQKALVQWQTRREAMTDAIRRVCSTPSFRQTMREVRSR